MGASTEEVQGWMTKAGHDLTSAQILTSHRPPVPDTACFHCQQAAEKALKAYLILHDVDFEKVHVLPYLIDLCAGVSDAFEDVREDGELLSAYAVEVRYPGAMLEPTIHHARRAYEAAKRIVNLVQTYL